MHATNHNDIRNNSNRTVDFLNLKTINLLHKEEIAEAVAQTIVWAAATVSMPSRSFSWLIRRWD